MPFMRITYFFSVHRIKHLEGLFVLDRHLHLKICQGCLVISSCTHFENSHMICLFLPYKQTSFLPKALASKWDKIFLEFFNVVRF